MPDTNDDTGFPCFVITQNTKDFPGKVVLRRYMMRDGDIFPDPDPTTIGSSVEEVRKFLPAGLARMPIVSEDDPVIVEWWM